MQQRFEYKQGRNERAVKIETPVNFPLSLNMLPYHSQARGADIKDQYEKARSCTYDLLSVVEHKGEIDTGHYVTYSRVGDQVSICFDCSSHLCTSTNAFELVVLVQRPPCRTSHQIRRPQRESISPLLYRPFPGIG